MSNNAEDSAGEGRLLLSGELEVMRRGRTSWLLRSWLPVLVWLLLIGFESSNVMSSTNTNGLLGRIISSIFGPVDRHTLEVLNFSIRKIGHFVGYATLSLLFLRALILSAATSAIKKTHQLWRPQLAAFAVLFTACIAVLDEFHQRSLASRQGTYYDVLLDVAGATFVQVLVFVMVRQRKLKPHASNLAANA